MICLFLDTEVSSVLKKEMIEAHDKEFEEFVHVPSCFLKINGKSIIDQWWDVIMKERRITTFYILTCALKYKAYERWATAKGLPISHVINNGNTMEHSDNGDCANIVMALSKIEEPVNELLVIGNKNLCIQDFNISCLVSFQEIKKSDIVLYNNHCNNFNSVSIDPVSKRVLGYGKDCEETKFSSPNLFILVKSTLDLLKKYVYDDQGNSINTMADFINSICSTVNIFGMFMQVPLIYYGGNTSLSDYHNILETYNENSYQAILPKETVSRSYARVGLVGNPSDGFYGKTLACTIQNFWAETHIVESETLKLIPHPLYDPMEFDSLTHLYINSKREGYYGGMRLLMASCKCFFEYCTNNGIYLHPRKFNLSYDTNIPRQVGLAGSSAIVSAVLKSLMKFYGVTKDIFPLSEQPNWTLNVETKELGITAGLQDRVVQLYEGLVYMDFSKDYMEEHNHGIYRNMDTALLPPLFLAYCAQPKDSGKVHSQVKQQWLNGDKAIDDAMKEFASYTDEAVEALNNHDYEGFKELFKKNFQLRRKVFGDAVIKEEYIHMVEIASEHDGAAKFPGSGGAVVGTCTEEKMKEMKRAYEEQGYVFVRIIPYDPHLSN